VRDAHGSRYTASVHGQERDDGSWEGWLEFTGIDGGLVLRTDRETTQRTVDDLAYWASGLEPAYLEGAFNRAQAHTQRREDVADRKRRRAS